MSEDDGRRRVVMCGVELGKKERLVVDKGLEVEVDVEVVDGLKMSGKEGRKIFGVVKEIEGDRGWRMD